MFWFWVLRSFTSLAHTFPPRYGYVGSNDGRFFLRYHTHEKKNKTNLHSTTTTTAPHKAMHGTRGLAGRAAHKPVHFHRDVALDLELYRNGAVWDAENGEKL